MAPAPRRLPSRRLLPLLCLCLLLAIAAVSGAAAGAGTAGAFGLGQTRRHHHHPSRATTAAAALLPGASQQHPYHRRRLPPLAMAASSPILGALKSLGARYSDWLYREPLKANTISGVGIVALGDAISQFIETDEATGRKRCSSLRELEPRRIFNAGLAGALFNGLLLPWWYQGIHRVLPVDTPRNIALKILGNCVAWGCAGNAAIMFVRRALDGEPVPSAAKAVKRDLWGVMKNDYCIWPIYDVLCFTMIPRHIQAMTTGTLGIAWATYLSLVTHADVHVPHAAGAPAAAAK